VSSFAGRHHDGGESTARTGLIIASSPERSEHIAVCAFFLILMYSYSLRAAASSSTGLGFALGRFRGGSSGGAVVAAPGFAGIPSRGRSVSATSSASAPLQAVEQPKQQQLQPQVPRQDVSCGEKDSGEVKQHDAHGYV
jgi:hypothetical protein